MLLSNARMVVINDAEIMKAIDQLHSKMMNTLLACSTNQMSSKINDLPQCLGGGGATCNITKLTSTTPLSSWHQSVIPILQHLARAGHEEVYQCLDNEYKKYERHLEIFNEGLEAEHKLQEIKNTNLIKLMNCSDYGAEILRNQNKTDPRFRLKSMTKRLSLNQYIAILSDDLIDTAIKSRIIANRSLKASSWLKPIYGWQDSEIYNMSNLEYKVNIKMMHGVPLMKEEQPCPDCNMMMSIFGTHGLVCTHGLNHAWHHDKWRDWLAEKLSIVIPNTSIEPRIESEGKKRADILCRGRLTYDNILGPAFYDVTAGNNLSAGILEKIEKGNIKLWMAGSEQFKRKERAYFDGRANELLGRGYAYKTLTFEIFGGISYEIKNLLDYFIELKEDDTDKIWKELSIYNMKLIAKRVLSKYKTYI
eukprot:918014_1